jgi:hypothetical protein
MIAYSDLPGRHIQNAKVPVFSTISNYVEAAPANGLQRWC